MSRALALLPEAALVLTGLLIFAGLMAAPESRQARSRTAARLGGVLLVAACAV